MSKPVVAVFMSLESKTRESIHQLSVLAVPSTEQCRIYNKTAVFKETSQLRQQEELTSRGMNWRTVEEYYPISGPKGILGGGRRKVDKSCPKCYDAEENEYCSYISVQ